METMSEAHSNLEEKDNPSILKDDFLQQQAHPFSHWQHQLLDWSNKKSISSIEINQTLPVPVYDVS